MGALTRMMQMTLIGRTVLVIDHEPKILRSLPSGLAFFGFNVFAVSSGKDAISLMRAHPELISLALIDLDLPGMDALETVQALHQLQPSLRCWFMSPDLVSQNENIPQTGVVGVFGKPIVLVDVVRALNGPCCTSAADSRRSARELNLVGRRDEPSDDPLAEGPHVSTVSITRPRVPVSR